MYSSGELLEECLDLVLYTDVRYNTNNKEVKKNIREILTKTVDRNRPQKSKKSPKKENFERNPTTQGSTQFNFLLARGKRRFYSGGERERENVFFSPAPVVVERIREREEDRCWPPKAGFNSLIRRERQGAENNRAFSRGTFQSSSSARRVVPFSIGG